MADRLLMEAGKLIVSKEGKDASDPALTPGDMMFNSDWLFSGTIIAAGVHVDTASYGFAKSFAEDGFRVNEGTSDTYTQVINFPEQNYVPTVLLIPLGDSRYWSDFGMLLLAPGAFSATTSLVRDAPITVTYSQIIIPRVRNVGNGWRTREDFIYVVMGM